MASLTADASSLTADASSRGASEGGASDGGDEGDGASLTVENDSMRSDESRSMHEIAIKGKSKHN